MSVLLVVLGIWLACFAGTLAGLIRAGGPGGAQVAGRVALADTPYCDFVAVETVRGYSLLDWDGRAFPLAGGDAIEGALHARGTQSFRRGAKMVIASVEAFGADRSQAQRAFATRCAGQEVVPGAPARTAMAW